MVPKRSDGKARIPQTNDTFWATLFCLICRYKFSCCSCKAVRKSSALKIECETKSRPLGNLDPGTFSEVGGQNGYRIERQPRGERLPGSETGPNAGLQPFRLRGNRLSSVKRLLESTRSSQKKAARPSAPGHEESCLSGNPGASHIQAGRRGGGRVHLAGVRGGGTGASPAPPAGPAAPPSGEGVGLRHARITQYRLVVSRRAPSFSARGAAVSVASGDAATQAGCFPSCAHAGREEVVAG